MKPAKATYSTIFRSTRTSTDRKLKTLHKGSIFHAVILVWVFASCTTPEKKTYLMELLPAVETGIYFANNLKEDEDLNIITFEYFYNGAGVGAGDINNDGLQDIFFAANMSASKLYLNRGHFKFEDITKQAGIPSSGKWATGVSMIDINQDHWLDIYVCYAGPSTDSTKRANELYINNGNNTFTEKAKEYGLADTGHSVQAAFFDYDKDGDLDVYILTNTTDQTGPNVIRTKRVKGEMINTDRLYRNNGNNTFTNVSTEAGITIEGYGLGISICDINNDGWSDIYVSNDYLSNDLLYINNRNGTFTDRLSQYFKHTSYSAMGNDVSDFNNDGLPDVVAVDMLPPDNKRQKMMFGSTNYDRYRSEIAYGYTPQFMRNTLQLNVGESLAGQPLFSEIGQLAGIEATDWSWSPLFADIDNDGWKDLLITNGYARDITNRDFASYKMHEFMNHGYNESVKKKLLNAIQSIEGAHIPIFAFKNKGDLTFSNQSAAWGFTLPSYSTGAAYADLDNDGDLDYLTNNIDGPAFIFQNHSDKLTQNHFLKLKFEGASGNIQGYGAKVWLYTDSTFQFQENYPYRGYQSSVEQGLHFGLAQLKTIDSVRIQWPDGKQQLLKQLSADQTLTIKYSDAKTIDVSTKQDQSQPLFKQVDRNITYIHHETEYADFKIQPLIPHKFSEDGPGIAIGDINGDGLDDFFIGGAYNQSGQFFVQQKNGTFSSKVLTHEKKFEEDIGVLLFDADGDHDNDLYIVSGGNEFAVGSPYYRDRLYSNDGHGNFSYSQDALPVSAASGSCVTAADYDADGDLDLFIGGRLTPQHYPQAGESYIYQNNNGRFTDVTDLVAAGLKNIGMVSAATWSDVDNDNQTDLVVVGEWMPITIFKNKQGKFVQAKDKATVANSTGWWNSIQGGDFDEDGDIDFIVGNLGLNTRYKIYPDQPVSICTGDFNQDGTQDAILAHYIQGVNRPAHPRDDLFLQLVQFKKKYPSYKVYSDATMESMFAGATTAPTILRSDILQSCYLENNGAAGWKLVPLPLQTQVAPVYGISVDDYNSDGHIDIALSGNSYAPDVLTGRYDAFKGMILHGNGNGTFLPLSIKQSGLLIDGNAKALSELVDGKGKLLLLATQNNDTLKVFENTVTPGKYIAIQANDAYAIMTHANGKKSKHEFYYSSGYLSQSSRRLAVTPDVKQAVIYSYTGTSRTVTFP
ncbi:VCBS repeat-containing protein [Ohtaekwangia kribbensis]|uniref:VCBS repeat-containing protein n=1 Tax=Ohtaekwangia kribbensis TaxID=688913 RepID=A0ABW3KBW0_9BACT